MSALCKLERIFGARIFALALQLVTIGIAAEGGGPAKLVKDINPLPSAGSSSPQEFVEAGGVLYFAAVDGVSGGGLSAGLWRTDGTAAGTRPVRTDVLAITGLTAVGKAVFFSGIGSIGGRTLWKSDGTPQGTVMVKEISSSGGAFPSYLTNLRGTLFFSACSGIAQTDCELWKSDGTAVGTVRVKDIWPGSTGPYLNSSSPRFLTEVNGVLFFNACDTAGCELWKSDGTEAGTVRVKDINPGPGSSQPNALTNVNGTLYFAASDGVSGFELWKSDGTEAGTVRVKDINPGPASSSPIGLTNVSGRLFFSAIDAASGRELWKTDGTEAGTVRVKDIVPGPGSSSPFNFLNLNGIVLFSACGAPSFGDCELWRSDGTEAGTFRVKDINPGPGSSHPAELVDLHGNAYFRVCLSAVSECQLWKSDGTEAGTSLVKSVDADISANTPLYSLTVALDKLFFDGCDSLTGCELWRSDGTPAGTALLKDINGGTVSSNPGELTDVNGTLFFRACTGAASASSASDCELWRSDGTETGTFRVKDIVPGFASSLPTALTNLNGVLLFFASDPAGGRELWRSDGTEKGTVRVKDILPGPGSGIEALATLVRVGGHVYFFASNGVSGFELWKSDGTEVGTVIVKDINPGPASSMPPFSASGGRIMIEVNGMLFFSACDSSAGCELWKSDGSGAGTVRVKDIEPGPFSSDISWLTEMNGLVFFSACDDVAGCELWKSDGTEAGTVRVKDILPGAFSSSPSSLIAVTLKEAEGADADGHPDSGVAGNRRSLLFFSACTTPAPVASARDCELWKSDGTEVGTVRVKDINPGPLSSLSPDPAWPAPAELNGRLLFRACNLPSFVSDAVENCELWRSDGTAAGTVMVEDILPGPESSNPSVLLVVNETLFFAANDGVHGRELWKTSGQADEVKLVQDIAPGPLDSFEFPEQMVLSGRHIFLTANDHTAGQELWAMPAPAGESVQEVRHEEARKRRTAARNAILRRAGLAAEMELDLDAIPELVIIGEI